MTRSEFREKLEELVGPLLDLVEEKNVEYAGDDPFKQWRKRGLRGQLPKIEDKMGRYDTAAERGGASLAFWQETLGDIAGHALCMMVWAKYGDDPLVKHEEDDE